jgi:DNA-binding MarR family transcriptional regulator
MNYKEDLSDIVDHLMELESFFHSIFVHHFPLKGEKKATLQRYRILKTLGKTGSRNLTELCTAFDMKKNTCSELLDRMVRDGLVERILSEQDRRKTYFALTDRGIALISDFENHLVKGISQGLESLSPAEVDTFITSLKNIIGVSKKIKISRQP